jgi:hypothetical protein
MACVTLKRSLDFDPLHSPSRPTKRRRCVPLHCTPEKSRQEEVIPAQSQPSVFRENKLTPAEIAENLRNEMKRLKKRRQFPASPSSMGGRSPPSSSMGFPLSPSSAPSSPEPMVEAMEGTSAGTPASGGSKEKPIFTLKQMTMIAERMCKERVEQVRLEYDQILQQKLSEQYDAFVKFIDQQIQKRFSESQPASYLS